MSTAFRSSLSTVRAETFRGVDLSSPPESVDKTRSPDAPNIMPGDDKKPTKRPGYALSQQFDGCIYGLFPFTYAGTEYTIVHAGTKLFLNAPSLTIATGVAQCYSAAVEYKNKIFFFDGNKILVITIGNGRPLVNELSYFATTPTVTISRRPDGGGTPFEDFNLLSKKFAEEFYSTEDATAFQLSYDGLTNDTVEVTVLDQSSTEEKKIWNTLSEGTDFSVDRTNGIVTFVTPPGLSPVEGEDNVRITAAVNITEYPLRITRCRVAAVYGVGGVENRLFLSGNPNMSGIDWYSEMDDFAYFGESHFAVLSPTAKVVGYSKSDGMLAAHCAAGAEGTVLLRSGELMDGDAVFPVKNVLHGPAACSGRGFGVLGDEPLFLTKSGVCALTEKDTTAKTYLQCRSWFINKALCAEKGLEHAVFCRWKDFMLIAVEDRVYLLDGGQKTYENAAPYSTFQYECYYWTGISAKSMAFINGRLIFGDKDGGVYAFHEPGVLTAESYTDCGRAIGAHWQLPDIVGTGFYNRKSLRGVYAELLPRPRTSVSVLINYNGVWQPLWQEGAAFRFFRWSGIKWSEFVWQCDDKSRGYGRRRLIPNLNRIRIRFENSVSGEPFGLNSAAAEFTETGKKAY